MPASAFGETGARGGSHLKGQNTHPSGNRSTVRTIGKWRFHRRFVFRGFLRLLLEAKHRHRHVGVYLPETALFFLWQVFGIGLRHDGTVALSLAASSAPLSQPRASMTIQGPKLE
jgi:hypothetical protein